MAENASTINVDNASTELDAGASINDSARAAVNAQAQEAVRGLEGHNISMSESQGPERTAAPLNDRGGYQHDSNQNGAPQQDIAQAGQALQNAGVQYDGPAQNDTIRAQMQNALDSSSTGEQNTSRCEAVRQEAAASPSAPSATPSMEM